MITLTSACAMDQSALYDSPGQELGHGEDHDHQKEEWFPIIRPFI